MMQQATLDVQNATYVGIDAHPTEHTAVAVNRFEEEKGTINFANSWDGIRKFLSWLHTVERTAANVTIGIEGRGGKGSAFITLILQRYEHIYEVNPQFTQQRRRFGTNGRKSDTIDAKCIAEVIIRKLPQLPKITKNQLSATALSCKKFVWYYEGETVLRTRLKN
jgi:hypothetical protein